MSDSVHTIPALDAPEDDSQYGGMFEHSQYATAHVHSPGGAGASLPSGKASGVSRPAVPAEGVTRRGPLQSRVVGRGPVAPDPRKFRYDVNRALSMPALTFGATRADRMDAVEAGDLLHRIHGLYGIDKEPEDVISAFDKALFFEHTVNGASLLQPGKGFLRVGEAQFELAVVKNLLGVNQRRFFRAFADDIVVVNREVLASYDSHDPSAAEKWGQIMQVAVERGLQKYPHLAHDSSDAGVRLSVEERVAVMASKRSVLESSTNNVDRISARVSDNPTPAV